QQRTPAEAGPSNGSGIVALITFEAGKPSEITIEVDGSTHKRFRYCFGDDTVVLDPAGKQVDIAYIQGLKVTFTAAPTRNRIKTPARKMPTNRDLVLALRESAMARTLSPGVYCD